MTQSGAAHARSEQPSGRSGREVSDVLVHVPRSPRGGSEKDQSVFRAALAAFLGTGLGRQAAVHRATRLVRDTTPDFDPALPPDFFD